jgi:hypothetical protein
MEWDNLLFDGEQCLGENMTKLELTQKLQEMMDKDANLAGQLKRLAADIAAALHDTRYIDDPDKSFTDYPLTLFHGNQAEMPTIPPYDGLVVAVNGVETENYQLNGEILTIGQPMSEPVGDEPPVLVPITSVTVSYSHIGTQPEIDAVVAFYPDVFDPAFYAERVMYWTQVQAAIAPFLSEE